MKTEHRNTNIGTTFENTNTSTEILTKNCNTVSLSFNGSAVSNGVAAFTIPAEWRPKRAIMQSCTIIASGYYFTGFFQVNTDGSILSRYFSPGVAQQGEKFTGAIYGGCSWNI